MNTKLTFKTTIVIILQGLGATLAFIVSLVVANMIAPFSPEIMAAAKSATGFLTAPLAFLFNGIANAVILVWAARRSSFRGLALLAQLFVLSFGAQVFMTQIETGYFLYAFPLLQGNLQLYTIVLHGLITSLLFSLLVTLMCGGFSKKDRAQAQFSIPARDFLQQTAWLAAAYAVLYILFGYFVAWQARDVRVFYSGSAELPGFFQQWAGLLMVKPELPVFQYFRGILWLLCLVPLFIGFSGRRVELVILSALALALLPTGQLAFANPLMPAPVSLAHFWEVSISTGIFGALCAWFVPQKKAISAQASVVS